MDLEGSGRDPIDAVSRHPHVCTDEINDRLTSGRGHAVAQLVEALCCKPDSGGFNFR
jgi:hypothetical protein